MKLLYVSTHQITNLIPLFRSVSKNNIDFKVIYWQNLSPEYDCKYYEKKINYGMDMLSGYRKHFLCNKIRYVVNHSFLFKFLSLFRLIKFLINEDFDQIIFHHSYLYTHGFCAIVAKLMGKKTIARSMSYNLGNRNIFKKILRFVYYRFFNLFYDNFWSIHKLNEEFFKCFGANENNIHLIHHCQGDYKNLINQNNNLLLSKVNFCHRYHLPHDKKFILFAGIFIERKNPKLLLECFIKADIPDDWILLMVGDGKFANEMKFLVKEEKIDNVKFMGFRDQKELIGFFSNSEILVAPSNSGDTHCNVAAEAIQFECAIIASNMVGLYPEFIKEKVGLVFDINKQEELIKHLKKMTSDINFLSECQQNAKEYGKKKTPEFSGDQIKKYFDE